MKTNHKDEQLIDTLKQLSQIEDQTDKDELFQRISTQMNNKKQRNHYKFWPIFSTVVVTLFILVMIPILLNLDMPETSDNDSTGDAVEESSQYDVAMNVEQSDVERNIEVHDSQIESYVVQSIDEDSTIIYGAVTDKQLQTVIPLSIIIPKEVDLNTHYNQLDQYLDETGWGVNEYVLNNVQFDLDLASEEVNIQIPEDFSLGEGSSNPSMFEKTLSLMFTPYHIEKVVFNDKIDLGSIGYVSELSLLKPEKQNYKVFQADEHRRKFLVPMKSEDYTIEEAFEDMKEGEEAFHIYATIPDDVEISLEMSDRELIISLNDDDIFNDEQKATIMIEAILMTAKSFGYEFVTFSDVSVDQVGPYQLSESIPVPEAINPMYR